MASLIKEKPLPMWIFNVNQLILMAAGISRAYCDKLLATKIQFEPKQCKFEDFFKEKQPKEQVYGLKASEGLFASVFVLQILQKLEMSHWADVMFIKETTILKNQRTILDGFDSKQICNLLIIEGAVLVSGDQETAIRDRILAILNKNKEKKVLLIEQENSTLVDKFKEKLPQMPTEDLTGLNLKDLTQESKEHLLQKKVIFQGKIVKAQEIFLSDEISSSNIRRIIGEQKLIVGTPIEKSGKFYLTQLLSKSVAIKKEVLQSGDVLAISSERSEILTPEFEGAITFDEAKQGKVSGKIILDNNFAEEEFEELRQSNAYNKRNVHWLSYDSKQGIFHWKQSSLSPQTLNQYLVEGEEAIFESFKSEEEFLSLNKEEGTFVISGAPGSGKSAMIDHMASLIKEKTPAKWVLKINLFESLSALQNEQNKRRGGKGFNPNESSQVLDFLLRDLLHLNKAVPIGPDDEEILREWIQRGQVPMLFDGFADLVESYRSILVDLFKGLKKLSSSQLIVTTTPTVLGELRENLNVGYYNIEALSLERQKKILNGYFQQNIKEIELADYKEVAEKLISAFTMKLNDPKLLKMPVVLKILSEVYKNNIKQLTETSVEKLDVSANVHVLFEKFLIQQFDLYYLIQYGTTPQAANNVRIVAKIRAQIMEDYENLGLYKASLRNNLKEHLPNYITDKVETHILPEIESGDGQLPQVVDEHGDFLVTTFEQFFISSFFQSSIKARVLKSDMQNYFLKTVLVDSGFQQTRLFLDAYFEANKIETIGTLDDDFGEAMELIWEEAKKGYINTFAHQAALEGHASILKFISASLKGRRSHVLVSLYEEVKNSDGATALHLAASSQNVNALEEILHHANVSEVKDALGRSPLNYAVSVGNSDILLKKGANMNMTDANGSTHVSNTPILSAPHSLRKRKLSDP